MANNYWCNLWSKSIYGNNNWYQMSGKSLVGDKNRGNNKSINGNQLRFSRLTKLTCRILWISVKICRLLQQSMDKMYMVIIYDYQLFADSYSVL